MENQNPQQDPVPVHNPPYSYPVRPRLPAFPVGSREWIFALAALIASLLLCNFTLYGGFQLGFAMAIDLCILISAGYLIAKGHRLTPYSAFLLGISLVIGAGFGRSDDGFVKSVMVCFLFVSGNLGLTLLARQQRHDPAGFLSLGDSFYTGFAHSLGHMGQAFSGLKEAIPRKNKGFSKAVSVVVGMAIALPLVFIMVAILMPADAAFEGVMDLLPTLELEELPATLICGAGAFCMMFCQGMSLQHREKGQPSAKTRKGSNSLTVNTVLVAVCGVYAVYLVSQLAYFTGGFAGILPEEFTMAEYARRGFFEMAVLCAINLTVIGLCVGLVEKTPKVPLLTRILCLFISFITVFFVAAASGKMFMYMDAYGLTRLRLLTQIIMLCLGISTVLVAVWILIPKLPYMKTILAAALIIGAVVMWVDVDNVVAGYNVDRYLSGQADTIDIDYLRSLNHAAVPHVARLAKEAPNEKVRKAAQNILTGHGRPQQWEESFWSWNDFRAWNGAKEAAQPCLKQ